MINKSICFRIWKRIRTQVFHMMKIHRIFKLPVWRTIILLICIPPFSLSTTIWILETASCKPVNFTKSSVISNPGWYSPDCQLQISSPLIFKQIFSKVLFQKKISWHRDQKRCRWYYSISFYVNQGHFINSEPLLVEVRILSHKSIHFYPSSHLPDNFRLVDWYLRCSNIHHHRKNIGHQPYSQSHSHSSTASVFLAKLN